MTCTHRFLFWLTFSVMCALFNQVPHAMAEPKVTKGSKNTPSVPTLEELKESGALSSSYRKFVPEHGANRTPQEKLVEFQKNILPVLQKACTKCHGPETQESDFRVDTLDPDLLNGKDIDWWIEVFDVIGNGEMPPKDEVKFADKDRGKVIDWLSSELQAVSQARRNEGGHSSFRRMTKYEYNYALQDLLGLSYDFASDLPPETSSEDGFLNSSELLQMTVMQFQQYRDLGRKALKKAIAQEQPPVQVFYGITMKAAADRHSKSYDTAVEKIKKQYQDDPEKIKAEIAKQIAKNKVNTRNAHYINLETGRAAKPAWSYGGARYAWAPNPVPHEPPAVSQDLAIIPARQKLIIDLGDHLPAAGNLRVRLRASRTSVDEKGIPSLRLLFGHQASNNSSASEEVGNYDVIVTAPFGKPQFYQWDIPLSEVVRNPFRGIQELGKTPNPAEYIQLYNSSLSEATIQIDYVEITAPSFEQWPPKSHSQIFIESPHKSDETKYAREVITQFMTKAWRRSVTASEVDQKMSLFMKFRKTFDFQESMVEVLAGVISSPKFLYLIQSNQKEDAKGIEQITSNEMATRLSMFLWCSLPDDELRGLAAQGKLKDPEFLIRQTKRMMADPRANRFTERFVRQWLGMQLLDFLKVDNKFKSKFDNDLKEAMQDEPIALFREVLQKNHSIIDFLHADYAMVNERLAKHYGISDVYGPNFRKVMLEADHNRGGLLTQAGLLAMNSDGKDSHPLKRGIWLLESILHDPPPPPPPNVPEVDLTDPRILKLTLKERIEDHRSKPACFSCHAKIDPWGIAFENFDAIGSWRTEIGDNPVDATSKLFNKQELDGIDGLKRFLLENRQDQFTRAMVYKLTTFALGRPLSLADRSGIDQITADLRKQDDGLSTLVTLIVTSELFQSK
ncbi:MAG: DUF1592 domain-containing protein [Pirellulales bacterium]